MLIDWLTLKIDFDVVLQHCGQEALDYIRGLNDVVTRHNRQTGEIKYETIAHDSIRSDTHTLNWRAGSELVLFGSPARCWKNGCNVFGSSNSLQCARLMVSLFRQSTGINLPDPALSDLKGKSFYRLTRMDITRNFFCGSLANARTVQKYFLSCDGGRYKVNAQAGDTCYWNRGSRRRSGKTYLKGPHVRHWLRKNRVPSVYGPKSFGLTGYTEKQLDLLDTIARAELQLGSQFWFDYNDTGLDWRKIAPEELMNWHDQFFGKMLGDNRVQAADMADKLIDKIRAGAVSLGHKETQGDRAHATFRMIQAMGYEHAKEIIAKSTWYRHLTILRASGLGDIDITSGRIVPIRRSIDLVPVSSWSDLRNAA